MKTRIGRLKIGDCFTCDGIMYKIISLEENLSGYVVCRDLEIGKMWLFQIDEKVEAVILR